jgi:hypothetical protein
MISKSLLEEVGAFRTPYTIDLELGFRVK